MILLLPVNAEGLVFQIGFERRAMPEWHGGDGLLITESLVRVVAQQ